MDEDDDKVEVDGQLTAESIKLISESMGISNLNDEAINLLIDDGTYRLKQLAQVSVKRLNHAPNEPARLIRLLLDAYQLFFVLLCTAEPNDPPNI